MTDELSKYPCGALVPFTGEPLNACTRPLGHADGHRSNSGLSWVDIEEPRRPLVHIPGHDNMPPDSTQRERDAAAHSGIPAAALEQPMSEPVVVAAPVVVPIIPPKVARIAGYVAAALGLVGGTIVGVTSLPAWVGFVVFAVAAVAGFISGAGLPSFLPARPLVSAALAAKLGGLAALLAAYAPNLPTEPKWILAIVGLVVAVLCALAGRAAPQMITVKATAPAPGPQP